MSCTSTFWKCIWFENMGSITKVMNVEVKNVPWRFCPFLHLESSDGISKKLLPISTLSYSRTAAGCCSPSTLYALSHSLSKCWHAFCHAWDWQTDDISHAAFTQARRNGAKIMAPRWRHDRAKVSRASKRNKTSQNHTSLLQELDCCRFEPKGRFWSAFQFSGTRSKWMYYSFNPNHDILAPDKAERLSFYTPSAYFHALLVKPAIMVLFSLSAIIAHTKHQAKAQENFAFFFSFPPSIAFAIHHSSSFHMTSSPL